MPMKHLSEYRDKDLAQKLIAAIRTQSKKPIRLMEVCGTHTVSIFRHGIRQVLPPTIQLISGPGCPVCVTATEEIDRAVKLARIPRSHGDHLRGPGPGPGFPFLFAKGKGLGADVRMVYSTFDALKLAQENPKTKKWSSWPSVLRPRPRPLPLPFGGCPAGTG